jgi:hypothetical protein
VLAAALCALAATLVPAGCGQTVTLGCDPDAGAPCARAVCGATCTLDPCAAQCEHCPTEGVCDTSGACVASTSCPAPPNPCEGKACGALCAPPDGPMPPLTKYACDLSGACVAGTPDCTPFNPCLGLPCNAPCNPCDPTTVDGGCKPPPRAMACNPMQMCVLAPTLCQ